MGVYIYTMRKRTKIVDGLTIGQAAFAYKDGWGAGSTPSAKRQHGMAYTAVSELEHEEVQLFIIGKWEYAKPHNPEQPLLGNALSVFRRRNDFLAIFKDGSINSWADHVGYLVKDGNKLKFISEPSYIEKVLSE